MSLRQKIVILAFLLGCVGTVLGLRYMLDQVALRLDTEIPAFTELEPGLYMGSRPDQPPPATTAVLCLSMDKDPYTVEHYRHQPIPDAAPAPTIDWLREQVQFVDEQRRAGRTLFVHCDAGISRSGMVMAAYLMWRERWSASKALAVIRTRRPEVAPNQAFMALLSQWESNMHKPSPQPPLQASPLQPEKVPIPANP